MAVYTYFNQEDFITLLENYNIGKYVSHTPVLTGVENTTYFLTTTENIFTFTCYENQIEQDLVCGYINLMLYMREAGVPCPVPIMDKDGLYLKEISKTKEKICALFSFLSGRSSQSWTVSHLHVLGAQVAKLHCVSTTIPHLDLKKSRRTTIMDRYVSCSSS